MFSVKVLRYIVQVAAVGSINKAAEVLYISQSNLSRSIQEAENKMGMEIFRRTNKGVITTHEGQIFIDRATKILDELDELQSRYMVNQNVRTQEISLSIGAERHYPSVFTCMQFYDRFCKNSEKYVNLILREGSRDEIVRLVRGDILKLGIIHYMSEDEDDFLSELSDMSIQYALISDCPVCAQISAKHPLAGQSAVTLEMLKDYPRIAFLDEDFTGINYASDIMQFDRNKFKKRIVLQERGTHRVIIENTNGYSIGTYYNIDNETDQNIKVATVIKCIPIKDIKVRMKTILIYKKSHRFTENEKAYIGLLINLYGDYSGVTENSEVESRKKSDPRLQELFALCKEIAPENRVSLGGEAIDLKG